MIVYCTVSAARSHVVHVNQVLGEYLSHFKQLSDEENNSEAPSSYFKSFAYLGSGLMNAG